jgi:serine phosphatase RsbU (regulator of sigma subunit)
MRGRPPADVVSACVDELDAFASGRFQDDVTLVALAIATPPP